MPDHTHKGRSLYFPLIANYILKVEGYYLEFISGKI